MLPAENVTFLRLLRKGIAPPTNALCSKQTRISGSGWLARKLKSLVQALYAMTQTFGQRKCPEGGVGGGGGGTGGKLHFRKRNVKRTARMDGKEMGKEAGTC